MSLALTVLGGLSVPAIIAIAAVVLAALFLFARSRSKKNSDIETADTSAQPLLSVPIAAAQTPAMQYAPGSAGEIKLYNVKDKQAAMIMAIVADHLKAPLSTLKFKSIKRID